MTCPSRCPHGGQCEKQNQGHPGKHLATGTFGACEWTDAEAITAMQALDVVGGHSFPGFWDRRGNPISLLTLARLGCDVAYVVVAEAYIPEVEPVLWVSTTWLGANHNYNGEPPLIFETMIFRYYDVDTATRGEVIRADPDAKPGWIADEVFERYPTEAAAVAGHDRAVMYAKERVIVN